MTLELAVAAGAALGAPARYAVDRALGARPGTLVVNLSGSALAGLLAGLAPGPAVVALVATGFAGSFTTASTLAWQVLADGGGARLLALHLVPGVLLAALGVGVGRAL